MPSRPALAISLYVSGRRCIVVGSGASADERVERLRAARADVVRFFDAGHIGAEDLAGAFMVFVCDARDAGRVSLRARATGALVYVHDAPELSDLAMPALARRGPITIAVSTDATAPALARRLREELEQLLATGGEPLDALVAEMARLRDQTPKDHDRLAQLAGTLTIDGRVSVRL